MRRHTEPQVELFAYGEPPVYPATPTPLPGSPVRWGRLVGRVQGLPCDDCMAAHVLVPNAPLARRARWSRRQARTAVRYLCHAHANQWRQAEGKGPLREQPEKEQA
jgi:hypothetical protein